MAVTKLADKRYRAQVYYRGKNLGVGDVLGGPSIFPKRAEATAAVARARARLKTTQGFGVVSLGMWADRWTSDPLFARPKTSTNRQNKYVVREFVELYGHLPLRTIDHRHISEYLAGGKRSYRVGPLKAMFQDAMGPEAGRLIDSNPWVGLKINRGKGNSDKQPPSEQLVGRMIEAAGTYGPSLQAWLKVACHTGMRPGELDGLQWDRVDFAKGRIVIDTQFNALTKTMTLPKNGSKRKAIMTAPAREALMAMRGLHPVWVFPGIQCEHLTPASRWRPWERIRESVGWTESLYLATRHYAGWWMYSVLLLDAEDVGHALGHKDGKLVRERYGHRSVDDALARVERAYELHLLERAA